MAPKNSKASKRKQNKIVYMDRYFKSFNDKLSEEDIGMVMNSHGPGENHHQLPFMMSDPKTLVSDSGPGSDNQKFSDLNKSNVVSFEDRKRICRATRVLNKREKGRRAIAVDCLGDANTHVDTELRFKTSHLKGYVQLIELKTNFYMVSGHLELENDDVKIYLVLPNGQIIDDLERDDSYRLFHSFIKKSFSLGDIQYRIY